MSRVDYWFVAALAYIGLGPVIGWFLDDATGLVPLTKDDGPASYAALMLLWPLFAIKFLAIGIWAVLSAGFTLLV